MAEAMNVLLITTDQMRRDHMGCSGNPVVRTPSLDRLAAGGTYLSRAYVNNPVCMPNRASLATGRYPRNHGCWWNGVDLPDCERTLAHELNDRGYHTAFFGKPHFRVTARRFDGRAEGIENGPAWEAGVNDPAWTGPYYGFQYVQISVGHAWANLSRAHLCQWVRAHHPDALRHQYDFEPSPTGAPECDVPLYPAAAHSSNWLGEIGSEYLRRRGADGRPFLLWVSFPDPHHPFAPPKPYDAMYDPAGVVMPALTPELVADKPPQYAEACRMPRPGDDRPPRLNEAQLREIIAKTYGMITLIDENVGRLLDALEAAGLADKTVVVFTSDHGDMMGDFGITHKGPWHTEGLINVPMLWRVPAASGGSPVAGASSAGLFSSCDVAPTVLALLGAEVPRAMDGLAQDDLVRGGEGRRDAACVEYRTPQGDNFRTIVTSDRKLTYYPGADYGELYDMTAGPPDARNLWRDPAFAGDRARLQQRLLDELILREDYRLWPTAGA